MKKLLTSTALALGFCATLPTAPAQAGDNPFLGEISWFAGNFAPRGWAFCDGQILTNSQNNALFSLLGTTYGGDGSTTFALPDMRGRSPMHPGTGPGLTPRRLGDRLGTETNTFTTANLPSHNHDVKLHGSTTPADASLPADGFIGSSAIYASFGSADTEFKSGTVTQQNVGGGQEVNNIQPSLNVSCIIALFGIYPSCN